MLSREKLQDMLYEPSKLLLKNFEEMETQLTYEEIEVLEKLKLSLRKYEQQKGIRK
jgi:hypothetical protein